MASQAIGAVGSVAQGVTQGKGAKKAAKIQAASQKEQLARLQTLYNEGKARFAPESMQGEAASARQNALLGLGTPEEQAAAIAAFKANPNYANMMKEGLDSINTSAMMSGQGRSGAAMKALAGFASNQANKSFSDYFGQVGQIADRGMNAKAATTGIATNYGTQSNQVSQTAADNAANYQWQKAGIISGVIGDLTGAAQGAFGSSFGKNGTNK